MVMLALSYVIVFSDIRMSMGELLPILDHVTGHWSWFSLELIIH